MNLTIVIKVADERDRRLLDEFQHKKQYLIIFKFKISLRQKDEEYLNQLNTLPHVQPTNLFRFHSNAEIMKDQQDTNEILRKLQQNLGYSSSLNTDFQQEITRSSKLMSIIQQSSIDTLNAIKGQTVISDLLKKKHLIISYWSIN
ncbi:unnamed protein product [Paramecium sonneborni]|uniref:Dynein heavy chain C-terminal domain-containing protein n=1 Tax=Paramecium sonneborni TaxID=65129 RepID=A0A8S1NRI1_9CILI|nr:unnamed protein product [Paramecium sonneborni]